MSSAWHRRRNALTITGARCQCHRNPCKPYSPDDALAEIGPRSKWEEECLIELIVLAAVTSFWQMPSRRHRSTAFDIVEVACAGMTEEQVSAMREPDKVTLQT